MASKLGLHIQKRRHDWPNAVADALPAVVKTLEWGLLDEWLPLEQTDPIKRKRAEKWSENRVFLLGRQQTGSQGLSNPCDRVHEFWNQLLIQFTAGDRSRDDAVLERMRKFDAWEGYNEVGTGADIENLGRFDALLARQFHLVGIKYACGGFSMTKPTLEEWPIYCKAMLDQIASGDGERPDFLHLHEYWYPPADYHQLLNPDGSVNAERMLQATRGYMLHWRELYELGNTPRELLLPVIISECGWDQGWPQQVGYRRSPLSDQDYLNWLIWYDQELCKPLNGIDYVVGATIYTYGHEPHWESFEIDDMAGRGILTPLRAYLREQNIAPHPQDWRKAWEPAEPSPGLIESHFVLMAQNANTHWRHALDKYLDTFKVTNGQSLDDAVRLTSQNHHITLVGDATSDYGIPAEWEAEIRRRDPSIIIDRIKARTWAQLLRMADRRAELNDRYGAQDSE